MYIHIMIYKIGSVPPLVCVFYCSLVVSIHLDRYSTCVCTPQTSIDKPFFIEIEYEFLKYDSSEFISFVLTSPFKILLGPVKMYDFFLKKIKKKIYMYITALVRTYGQSFWVYACEYRNYIINWIQRGKNNTRFHQIFSCRILTQLSLFAVSCYHNVLCVVAFFIIFSKN